MVPPLIFDLLTVERVLALVHVLPSPPGDWWSLGKKKWCCVLLVRVSRGFYLFTSYSRWV